MGPQTTECDPAEGPQEEILIKRDRAPDSEEQESSSNVPDPKRFKQDQGTATRNDTGWIEGDSKSEFALNKVQNRSATEEPHERASNTFADHLESSLSTVMLSSTKGEGGAEGASSKMYEETPDGVGVVLRIEDPQRDESEATGPENGGLRLSELARKRLLRRKRRDNQNLNSKESKSSDMSITFSQKNQSVESGPHVNGDVCFLPERVPHWCSSVENFRAGALNRAIVTEAIHKLKAFRSCGFAHAGGNVVTS